MNPRHVVGVLVIVVVVVVEESATTAFPKFSLEEAFKYHASTAEKNDATVAIEGMVTCGYIAVRSGQAHLEFVNQLYHRSDGPLKHYKLPLKPPSLLTEASALVS